MYRTFDDIQKMVSSEFSYKINNSTEYRNEMDYIIVEFTCHLIDNNEKIIVSKVATEKYTYDDVAHAAHNGSMNFVPYLVIKF